MRAGALDRSRLNVAGYAQPLGICPIAHPVQLFDGDVITFAFLHARVGEITEHSRITTVAPPNFRYLLVSLDMKITPTELTLRATVNRVKTQEGT